MSTNGSDNGKAQNSNSHSAAQMEKSPKKMISTKPEESTENYSYVPNDLLAEYHETVEKMRSEILVYEKEQEGLSNEVLRLVEENKRLSKELRDVTMKKKNNDEETNIIHNLQEQLRTLIESRDSAIQMWQNAAEEVTRLENIIQEKSAENEFNVSNDKVTQITEEYASAVNVLKAELLEAKEQLRKVREPFNLAVQELKECNEKCDDLQKQLKIKESVVDDSNKKYYDCQEKLLNMEMVYTDYQNRLMYFQQNEEQLKSKISSLEQFIANLQKQNAEIAVQESKTIQEAKESIRMVENAVLQREEAIFREQQAFKESERLQASFNQLVETTGQRIKLEVDNIKKKCNENIKQLMEEMYALEQDNSEKQAQYDRVLREKRAAEAELETLYNEGLHKGPQNSPLYEDLVQRLTNAEQFRNQAQFKIQFLETEMQKIKNNHQQEIALYSAEKSSLQDRINELQENFKQICAERIRLTDQSEQMKQQCKEIEEHGLYLEKMLRKENQTLKRKFQQQEEEWQYQLKNMDETYQNSNFELRKLLDAQKSINEKCKVEVHELTNKLEKETREMYKEILQYEEINEKLHAELEKSQIKISQGEQQLAEYNNIIFELQQKH